MRNEYDLPKYARSKFVHIVTALFFSIFLCSAFPLSALEEDGYPVENHRLKKFYGQIGSEECASDDLAWFVSETESQALVIMLYTDYHRLYSWHFNPENIPEIIFNDIELDKKRSKNSALYIPLSPEEKPDCLKHFLKIADRISSHYFVTNKGLRLGMPPQKVIDYYGNPDQVETTEGGKLMSWDFAEDPAISGIKIKANQRFVKDSYGYHLKVLFDNEKAKAIIMISDIP